ncbi:hypothetical protein [Streptomyces sp. NPDC004296]
MSRGTKPVAGCDVCRALAGQSAAALARGDKAKAAECNDEIQRHPHGGRK